MLLLLPAFLFSDINFFEAKKKKGFHKMKTSRCLNLISTTYYVKKRSLINEKFFLEMSLKENNSRNLCYNFSSQASSLYFFFSEGA